MPITNGSIPTRGQPDPHGSGTVEPGSPPATPGSTAPPCDPGAPEAVAADPATLPLRHRLALTLQIIIGNALVIFYAPLVVLLLRWGMGYRIHDLAGVRRRFRELMAAAHGPVLICPNHLTMIDSAIIAWGIASPWRYIVSYQLLPWNMPEQTNFANPLIRLFCYIAKCVPIVRGGGREAQQLVFAKFDYLLQRGDLALAFPEGRRSRTGSVDSEAMADGVGRLVKSIPGCRVLCVYLRGEDQAGFSGIPRRGERFTMDLRLFTPQTTARGVRGTREIAAGIVNQLVEMEAAYRARRQ